MEFRNSRSQILIRGDNHSPTSSGANQDLDVFNAYPRQLSNLFTDNVYLSDPWHDDIFLNQPDDDFAKSTWRLKDRMKTAGVALVLCLNLGTDPPDVVKPAQSARRECWFDPTGPKQKGLEVIGNALQQQYERWQSKAKYKQCLDPTSEDLRRLCINLRKAARNDRLLFHYNGHGVPRPTKNGELWVFGKHYTHYMPVAIAELRSWLGDPAIYVLDCSGAGALLPHFMDLMGNNEKEKEKERERDSMKGSSAAFAQFMSPTSNQKGSHANLASGSTGGINGNHQSSPGVGLGLGQSGPAFISNSDYSTIIDRSQPPPTPFSPIAQQAGVDSQTIVLAACRGNEILPLSPQYPADLFTSCLTTPIPIALRWFILQNPHSMGDISVELSENIPGDHSDRKTPRGELHWIFTAVTDTIAWNTLPSNVFQKLFREDLLAASLFRNFLLAKRLMKSLNCTPQSWPPLPDSSTHPLWQTWDLAAESCLFHISSLQRGLAMTDPRNNQSFTIASNSTFFTEHLTAFEIWLDFGDKGTEAPMHLPILLQVLLSQTHRLRALQLLKRYLSLGSYAVNLSLVVGIFPYVLKLLQSPAGEVRQLLVSIWASILGFDPSCRQELVRDKMQGYFIQYLLAKEKDMPTAQRCMAAFVLAEICNGYRDGQHSCLQQGLHRTCTGILRSFIEPSTTIPMGHGINSTNGSKTSPGISSGDATQNDYSNSNCKLWISLCLFKLSEDFAYAKYLMFTEAGHSQLYPLLQDVDVSVRAASILALGELFGASTLAPSLAESAQNTTNAPSAVNIGHSMAKGFLGKPSTPSLASMSSSSMGGGMTMLPPGFSRPHPSPSPSSSSSSSSVTASPFGVSAAALSAHGHNQVQGQRSQLEGLNDAPSSIEFSAFGSANDNNPISSSSLSDSSNAGCSNSNNMFQGKKVILLSGEQMELLEAELLLAMQLLKSCTDGSVLVRREAVIAISKFIVFPHHMSCMKLVASGLLMESTGAASYEKAKTSWNSTASSTTVQMPGKSTHGSVGNDLKEKEMMTSSAIGSGTVGSNSARSLSGGGGGVVSTHHSNNISSKLSENLQNQGKNVSSSDPWHLSLSQSESIVDRLAQYLQCGGYSSTPDMTCNVNANSTSIFAKLPDNNSSATATVNGIVAAIATSVEMKQPIPKLPSQISGNNGINTLMRDTSMDKKLIPPVPPIDISKAALASSAEKGEEEGDISKSVMMARAYVRLWLALREVQVRDPHSVVATAAAAVIRRVTVQLDKDMDKSQRRKDSMDRTPSSPSSRPGPMASGAPRERDSPGPGQSLFSPSFGVNRGKSPSLLNMYSVGGAGRDDSGSNPWDRGGPILPPGPSPLPPSMSAQEITRRRGAAPSPANRTGTRPSSSAVNRGPSPNPSFGSSKFPTGTEGNGAAVGVGPMMNTPDQSSGSNYFGAKRSDGIISASSLAGISDLGATGIAQNNNIRSDSFQTFDDEEEPIEYEKDPALTSCLYTWSRKLFLTPAPGHEPYSDPLSLEGCSRLYRDSKLNEILRHEQKLSDIFKYVDDKEDLLQLDRKMKEDLQSAKTTMVAALPSSVTKFEQKAVLNIETAEVTSLVMFHSFHDILAVSDGYGVGIWSLACGSRIMQIPNLSGYRNQSSSSNTASYRDNHRKYSLSLNEKDKGGNTDRAAGSGEGSLSGRIPQGLGGISPGLGASLIISTGTLAEGSAGQAQGTAGIAAAVAGRTRTGSFSLLPSHVTPSAPLEGVARVTAMLWINETYESLLLMGSDDGSVKVWKDSADTETIAAHNSSIQSNQTQTDSQKEREMDRSSSSSNFRDGAFKGPVVTASSARLPRSIYGGFYNSSEACNTGASLASAFIALPDVAQDSRGSGMVLSWIQPSGTLVAGGNSSTIRVWDVGREQCVRVFDTGLDTCTTAIASRTVAMDFSSTSHMSGYPYGSSPSFTPSPFKPISDMPQLVSWTFAGSADGTVSVFDERVPSTAVHGGRVHCSRDHSAWIVSAHLRADGVPQVITGSVRGVVKFWDLRSMRTFKTFEVHKSPLTALAVHSCAPIIATGSHAQFIKILTLGGDQLGSIIKYHDGFLGQRIGPVSCLAFHPTRMRLAAGATDSIVSIYTTASDM